MNDDTVLHGQYTDTFEKNGKQGMHTFLWKEVSPSQEAEILGAASMLPGELPVATSIIPEHRILLSTRRLLLLDQAVDFPLQNIISVSPTAGPGKTPLAKMSDLILCLKDGREIELRLEPGSPLCGIWNILVFIVRQNARKNRGNHPQ
jgi:hypothetical protein